MPHALVRDHIETLYEANFSQRERTTPAARPIGNPALARDAQRIAADISAGISTSSHHDPLRKT